MNRQDNKNMRLTNGQVLAKNTVWNLIGHGSPVLAAVVAIPLLIKGLGTDRFGVLTLAWVVIGYFSLFDLGLGRTLTKLAAEKLGAEKEQEIPALVWTSLLMMGVLGMMGALFLAWLSPWMVHKVLKIPEYLLDEGLSAFYLLALSLPIVISTAGLRGILEAYQRFDLVNAVRIPMGLFTFLGPLLVMPFSNSLHPIVAVLVVGRLIAWGVHLMLCLNVVPKMLHGERPRREMVWPLLSYGSWMTVSNIISPLMVYMDRFLIGILVSATAVAYYATPYEIVIKLLLIPSALVGVLFPAFSNSFVQDQFRTAQILSRGIKYVFLLMFPLTLLTVAFARDGLGLWLGEEFAQNSTSVLQWLAVGVLINSLAQLPHSLVQGVGRPDLTAKLHFYELLFYLPCVWWSIKAGGIKGAATVWTGRMFVDMILLFVVAQRLLPRSTLNLHRIVIAMGAALISLALAALPMAAVAKIGFILLLLFVFALFTWFFGLKQDERVLMQKYIKFVSSFVVGFKILR